MDEDFLDMIDQAFLEGQIDGEALELVWLLLEQIRVSTVRYTLRIQPVDATHSGNFSDGEK